MTTLTKLDSGLFPAHVVEVHLDRGSDGFGVFCVHEGSPGRVVFVPLEGTSLAHATLALADRLVAENGFDVLGAIVTAQWLVDDAARAGFVGVPAPDDPHAAGHDAAKRDVRPPTR
jgi:hypothetical protein